MNLLRARLTEVPEAGIPHISVLTAALDDELRVMGRGLVGSTTVLLAFAASRPPTRLEVPINAGVLLAGAKLVRQVVRTTELVLLSPPDAVLIYSPGAEPLEVQGMVPRLEQLLTGYRLAVGDGEVILKPQIAITAGPPAH